MRACLCSFSVQREVATDPDVKSVPGAPGNSGMSPSWSDREIIVRPFKPVSRFGNTVQVFPLSVRPRAPTFHLRQNEYSPRFWSHLECRGMTNPRVLLSLRSLA